VLAEAVERCFAQFTGLPVRMLRWNSIWCEWEGMVPLPSLHDMDEWILGRNEEVEYHVEGLQMAVDWWKEDVEEFPLLEFAEFCWRRTEEAERRLEWGVVNQNGNEDVVTEEGSLDDFDGSDEGTD
jgi:hypothetical protein